MLFVGLVLLFVGPLLAGSHVTFWPSTTMVVDGHAILYEGHFRCLEDTVEVRCFPLPPRRVRCCDRDSWLIDF